MMNETTGEICIRKLLIHYDIRVFEYLKNARNEHIPEVYDFHEENGKLTVYEEYVRGRSFREFLEQDAPDEEEKKKIILEVLDGLSFLHAAAPPVIHRDIKPENIMISNDGRIMIVDYDAANIFAENARRDTTLIGTVGSAAPEQFGFGRSDARTDLYAVGVMIRELIPGDEKWQKAAAKATQIDPANRFMTAEEMRAALTKGRRSLRNLLPPPGFRTCKVSHMIAGVLGYAIIFYFSLTLETTNAHSAIVVWMDRIMLLIALLGAVDVFFDWTGLFEKLPFQHFRNRFARFTGRLLFSFGLLLLLVTVFSIVEQVLGLI